MENRQVIKNILIFTVIALIGSILYYRVISFGFLNWDDGFYIVQNQYIKTMSLSNIFYIFTHFYHAGTYQPLQLLTYMFIYSISKLDPMWFHIINAAIFTVDAMLVYLFVDRLNTPFTAAVAALLFLLSPVNVDSSAWVSGLTNTQSLFFVLVSLIAYDSFIISNRYRWYTISIIAFIAALLTKQAVATIVVVMFVLEWFVHKRPFAKTFFNQILFYILSAIAFSVFLFGRIIEITQNRFVGVDILHGFMTSIANMAGILEYPNKLLLPIDVSSFYPPFPITGIFTPRFLVSFIALIIIILFATILYKKKSTGFFWLSWYFASMIPAFGILPVPFFTNWYLFLPSVGIYALLGMVIQSIYPTGNLRRYALILCGIIMLMFGIISWQRIGTWKDDIHLWQDGIKRLPNYYFGYEMYAMALVQDNKIPEAIKYVKRSLQLNPYNPKLLSGLGIYYMSNKHYKKALPYIKDALKYDPGNAAYMYLLAVYYKKINDYQHYEEQLRKCVLQDPYELSYVSELTTFYADNGETQKAIQIMKEIISTHPDNALFYRVLGIIYLKYTNNIYEAKKAFEKSLLIDPQQKDVQELERLIIELNKQSNSQ
jgi:tetratricopeptide (TPR) repeat protein